MLAIAVSTAVGILGLVWAYQNGLVLAYSDSLSHLNIARRVLDSRTPGVVQLGTVWLPVPHVLMQPFIYIDFLWHTGLAGSIVGLLSFVVTAAALFLSARRITQHETAAWIGLAVFLSNPNVLYIQTTPLTEPVLLMSMTASAYCLLRWSRSNAYSDLLAAGLMATLAAGTRYDGWFFAAASGLVVLITVYSRSGNPAKAEGVTLSYAVLPAYAMLMWLFYNWTIFGDPLAFQRGEFSVQLQQARIAQASSLPTKHNIVLSALTYSWAVLDNLGGLVVALALVAVVIYLISTRLHPGSLIPYVFLSSYPFNIIALWLGQTIITVPQSVPPGFFNVRYGLLVLPGAALFIAYLADFLMERSWSLAVTLSLAVVLAVQFAYYIPNWPASIITVVDGLTGSSAKAESLQTAQYLHEHYDGGGILIDDTMSQAIHEARIDMHEYIATFSGPLWIRALEDPAPYVRWVVMHTDDESDRVTAALISSPNFTGRYALEFEDKGYAAYRRVEGSE